MKNKCLILYSSNTGNTEKVAKAIKITFEKNKWYCSLVKIPKDADVKKCPVNLQDYEFLCLGSGTYFGLAANEIVKTLMHESRKIGMKKVVPGPKCGIVFVTYGGAHIGPKEASPAIAQLENEMEHHGFKCVGIVSAPGKMIEEATPQWYHGDLRFRPDQGDLDRIEDTVQRILSMEGIDKTIISHAKAV